MKRSTFGVSQLSEVTGAIVLICIVLFVAALVNAGLLKGWFQPSATLRILLPEQGVAGLAVGAEVQVLGIRAGEVRRIVIDPSQRMHAEARIDDQMTAFIRRDSQVVIRRQFGVAGAAYLDVSRGTGEAMDWGFAVLSAGTDRAPTDTIGQVVDELRARLIPLLDEVQKGVVAFTAVANRLADPAGPMQQTLASVAGVTQRLERGDGAVGKLLFDDQMAKHVEASLAATEETLVRARSLLTELERSTKDARIPALLQRTEAVLSALQTTTRNLARASPQIPQITQNVASSTEAVPSTLLQAQMTARELELLLGQLRHHWLLGGSAPPPPASRRAPAVEVRP
ncbi:MCE family protein [Vineibacter terrae]|uniref:MCE family protein n=1 Tax=Vineibacter terrae TaxID=2586908 RepID=A0A5C8PCQ8_9HYPH|nr:MlaD family protein [Vineibacter terrae]TXL71596.1 MCE family protein [Vineibacter terrae]